MAAFLIGRRLFDERTGLFAAALVAVFPMDVLYAGTLFGNAPESFFAGSRSGSSCSRLALVPGAERLASIAHPDTLYLKLLRTRPALAVLLVTRPDYRVRDLEAKTEPWTLELYRLPAR